MQPNHPFFAVLRAGLWSSPFSPDPEMDFPELRRELKAHAITNLAAEPLAAADPKNQLEYIRSAALNYRRWLKLMQVQQTICDIMERAGIPWAVLKGAAADIHYPQPQNRSMGDIDILVRSSDLGQAISLLLNAGFALEDDRNPRHFELSKEGVHVELHRQFAVRSTQGRGEQLDALLFSALDRAEKKEIEGLAFYMLPEKENGIVLLEHMNSHMASGLGLRQIIDWMLYVDHCLNDEAWFTGFEAAIEPLGLRKLALTVTRMCQLYLGLRRDITWCQVADDRLCHRLMGHTLRQGNFGRKMDRQTHGTVGILNALDSDLNFFQLLHRHGCYNWKAVRKYPWLKPFAWIYQLFRYARKGLRGRNPLGKFLSAFRKQKENMDLLTDLEVQLRDHALKQK